MRSVALLLLAPAVAALVGPIHTRTEDRPWPHAFGRPPGGLKKTLWHTHTGTSQDELYGDADPYPWVVRSNFTQKMDHFDANNDDTWQQRYYYNPKYYNNTNLIFIMIGGEGPEGVHWAGEPSVTYLKWAAQYGAAVFDLEHRFFGPSRPINDMKTESLRLCTTEQALYDLANFIQSMNAKHNFTNPRWVTFGGSYPGALSAFFREKFPQLTVGAVASSAPINLKLDFYEYAMVVEDTLRTTDAACPDAVAAAWEQMEKLSLSIDGREQLNTYFNLDPPFDDDSAQLDITNFFANIFSIFQGMIQYTYDGQTDKTKTNATAAQVCRIMQDDTEPDYVKRVNNVWLWYNSLYPASNANPPVFANSYNDLIKAWNNTDYDTLGDDAWMRGWMWLCCNEIGYMQTTDQGRNIFRALVPVNYFFDMCTDMFGQDYTAETIKTNNDAASKYYNVYRGLDGYTANTTNVVLPNGSLDPWHALGLQPGQGDGGKHVVPVLINGTAHCSDMYPVYPGEPAALVAARKAIQEQVEFFIGVKN